MTSRRKTTIGRKQNLIGMKFDHATVISEYEPLISPNGSRKARWLCLCDCGNDTPFIRTSYELTHKKKINCGCQKDTRKGKRISFLIGEEYANNKGCKFKIIGYTENPRKRKIMFESGYEDIVMTSQIQRGVVRDMNYKTYYGIGCLGMKNATNHPLYHRWLNMIGRCYNKNHDVYNSYGAKGVTVSEELCNFKNYVEIVSKLPHYEELLENPEQWDIDKDFNSKQIKIYSKDTIKIMLKNKNLELENKQKRIKVQQFTLNMEHINTFESITEASNITGIHGGNISRAVREKRTAGGYVWRNYYDTGV